MSTSPLVPRPCCAAGDLADRLQRGRGSLVAGAIARALDDARAADQRFLVASCADLHSSAAPAG